MTKRIRYISAKPRFYFIMGILGLGVAVGAIGVGANSLMNVEHSQPSSEQPTSPVETVQGTNTPEPTVSPLEQPLTPNSDADLCLPADCDPNWTPTQPKTPAEISNWAEFENPDHAHQPIVDPNP